jgi:RsiW-degrading membrane proteinase PrsW (M82 family)
MDTKLILAAIFPGIALALIVYLMDRYDREPLRLLIKIFILGMLAVFPASLIEQFLINMNPFAGILGTLFTAFIIAGLTEEYIKRYLVMRYAYKRPEFDEKLDGIVYAVFVSLGFATAENISYVVFTFASNPYIGIFRGFVSVPAHMLFAITMGYYISLSKFSLEPGPKNAYLRKALFVPMVLHGIFDFILLANMLPALLAFVPFTIYLWVVNLKKLNLYYKESKSRKY